MLFSIGLLCNIIVWIYANFFMTSGPHNRTWTDAFFGLLALLGIVLIVLSFAIHAYQYLP